MTGFRARGLFDIRRLSAHAALSVALPARIFLSYEKNLPTFQAHAQTPARLPRADEHQRRSRHSGPSSPAGPQASAPQGRRDSLRPPHRGLTGCCFNPGGLMAALKLPKAARLTRREEFATVREQGTAQHGKLMVLGTWQSPSSAAARFGVIAARRTGPAHERNRARRRLREIFRAHRPSLPAGIWMVVVLRGSAVRATFAALTGEWRALASRAGYLKV